jgi:hypothetical protein
MKTPLHQILFVTALVPLAYLLISIALPQSTTADHSPLRSTFPATVAQPRDCR